MFLARFRTLVIFLAFKFNFQRAGSILGAVLMLAMILMQAQASALTFKAIQDSKNYKALYDKYDMTTPCGAATGSIPGTPYSPTPDIASFVDRYGQMAYDSSLTTSVPYEFVLGQATLESNYGASELSAKYNNFFGIKAGSSWTGTTVTLPTQEVVNGVSVTVMAVFRTYATAQDGFADHDAFFHDNQRYAGAFQYSHDPIGFLTAIAQAGYATGPNYISSVSGRIQQVIAYVAQTKRWPPSSQVTYTNPTAPTPGGTPVASTSCVCPTTASPGAGASLAALDPALVPAPYAAIFTQAGTKYNVAPAFLAAIFYGGEHGNSFPIPPPPYGNGPAWATSYAGANGPFQFIPGTWSAYGVDGNGDGKADVQDLTDAAFGAANYFATGFHIAGTIDELKLRQAAADYNGIHDPHASYPNNVWAAFLKFNTGSGTQSCPGGGSVGGYLNPYRGIQGLTPYRIDEGVDYGGSGPIYALGNATVLQVNTSSGWPGGNFGSYKLSDGPAAGKIVYFAENCPLSMTVGQNITSNTVICTLRNAYPYSESGWGSTFHDTPASYFDYIKVADGSATAYGQNYNELLVKLGVPSGTYQFANQRGGQNLAGALPAGWPTW